MFPLIQLPKKFKVGESVTNMKDMNGFPLIQLPKKFKDLAEGLIEDGDKVKVSINSTSEEV